MLEVEQHGRGSHDDVLDCTVHAQAGYGDGGARRGIRWRRREKDGDQRLQLLDFVFEDGKAVEERAGGGVIGLEMILRIR